MNAPSTAMVAAPERRLQQLIPLDGRKLKRAEVGPRPEQLWVKVADLRIDRSYQRELSARSRALILAMVQGWDWRLAQALTVAELPGGLWELIDGQHRALAAMTHGAIAMLPAVVLPAVSSREAAAAFVRLNSARVQVTAGQALRAAIEAGDAVALSIKRAATMAGVKVHYSPPQNADFKPGSTLAVGIMRRIAETQGEAALAAMLQVCAAAGLAPIRAEHLRTLQALRSDPRWAGAAMDAGRLTAALQDWDRVADAAELARLDAGMGRTEALAVELFRRAGK